MKHLQRTLPRANVSCRVKERRAASLVALVSTLAVLMLSSCSNERVEGEGTVEPPGAATVTTPMTGESASTTAYSEPDETTFAQADTSGPDPYRMTLRLEGSEGTRFSGDCDFGSQSRRIEGGVPDSIIVDTGGSSLDCRIQKSGDGSGELRVVLTSDGRTRSVQQAGLARRGVSISYNPAMRGG